MLYSRFVLEIFLIAGVWLSLMEQRTVYAQTPSNCLTRAQVLANTDPNNPQANLCLFIWEGKVYDVPLLTSRGLDTGHNTQHGCGFDVAARSLLPITHQLDLDYNLGNYFNSSTYYTEVCPPPTATPVPTVTLIATVTPLPTLTPTPLPTLLSTPSPSVTPSIYATLPPMTPTPTLISPIGCPTACMTGLPARSSGNANCDAVVDNADFSLWQEQWQIYAAGGQISATERIADFDCRADLGESIGVTLSDFEFWRRSSFTL